MINVRVLIAIHINPVKKELFCSIYKREYWEVKKEKNTLLHS